MATDLHDQSTTTQAPLPGDRLARGLGWASLGLGVPQVLSPGGFAKVLGLNDEARERTAVTTVGVREFAAAAGLLRRTSPAWLWARVGGDAMDLALLVRAIRHHDGRGVRRTVFATASVAGITAVDVYAAVSRSRQGTTTELTASTTVARHPHEMYAFWHDVERLPTFMAHLEQVRVTGNGTSHWRARAPFGSIEWDAETVDDVPGERIAWRSVPGTGIANEGVVTFRPAPGDRGTEVHVTMRYLVPGGRLGELVARYVGEDPHQQLDDDLRRFKQVVETGEVVRSDGAPWGKRARAEFPQRPAQPMTSDELAEEVGT